MSASPWFERLGRQSAFGLVFALVLIVVAWTTMGLRLGLEHDRALRAVEREHENLARVFEAHAQRTLTEADSILEQVAHEYQRTGTRVALERLLRPGSAAHEPWRALLIVDARGQAVRATTALRTTDLRDWPPYRAARTARNAAVHVGDPDLGRVLDDWTFTLSRRLETADGSFAGLAAVALDAGYFAQLYDAVQLGPQATLALVGHDGIVRAARGSTGLQPGHGSGPLPIFQEPEEIASGHFRLAADGRGDAQLYTYRWLRDYPVGLLIGVSEDAALAGYRRTRQEYLAVTTGLTALLAFFALLTVRQGRREARAEAALRTAAERLRDAQRLARIGNWELDLQRNLLHWSDEIYRIFEIDPRAFGASYDAFLACVHPDDRAAVDRAYRESVARRQPYSIDHRLLMPDGRVKHVHEECRTDYDPGGRALRSVGTIQDITERKTAEETHARFAALVECANDAIVSRSLDGIITSWNSGATRLFGYTAAEAVGRSFDLIRTYADPQRLVANAARIARGDIVEPFETTRRHKDGTALPVLVNLSSIRDEGGAVTGVSVIMRDLREEHKARAQLALAASVFEHAAEGILITDADNDIVSVNRAFTRITGYAADEVIGRNPRMLHSGTHGADFYRHMWRTLTADGVWQGEVWDQRRNGEVYCQSLSIASIRDDQGEVRNYCAVFIDITRSKRAEQALVRLNAELEARVAERTRELEASHGRLLDANEELQAFSYSVSHDLRAPLRRIDGYATLALQAGPGESERVRNWLARIQANASSMGSLVEDLLRLSTITARDMVIEDFDLTRLVEDVAAALREEAGDGGRRITLTVAPGMRVRGDRALVRILVENLLGNAWKFTRGVADTRITVGTQTAPEGRAWFVQDNGAGFDMRRAQELFRPFRRLHGAHEYEGTGIGLSIVQRIAHKHGGRAWAVAEPGRGATFYFIFDTADADTL